MRCTPERTWVPEFQCANQAACSVTPDKSAGACAATDPRCTEPGLYVCDGTQLFRCSEAQDRLIPVESCESAAHCNAAAANEQAKTGFLGTCLTPCEPNAIRCVGAEFQRCSADGTWAPVMACASPNACSARVGSTGCEPCAPGALECNDGELRRCAPDSASGWEIVQDCGVARLCNEAEGRCVAGFCPRAGQTECNPKDGLRRCIPDQSDWNTIDICAGDLYNAPDVKCNLPACEEDARRCWEGAFQRCNESLRSWDTLQVCEDGETCSLDGCSPTPCTDDEFRCNDLYLERCANGVWEREQRCATAALCNATDKLCEPPQCEASAYVCDGATLKRCNVDRTGQIEADCGQGKVCDPYRGECR